MFIISELFRVYGIIYAMCSIISSFEIDLIFYSTKYKTATYDTASPTIRMTHSFIGWEVSWVHHYLLVSISLLPSHIKTVSKKKSSVSKLTCTKFAFWVVGPRMVWFPGKHIALISIWEPEASLGLSKAFQVSAEKGTMQCLFMRQWQRGQRWEQLSSDS